jgi:hemerythrin
MEQARQSSELAYGIAETEQLHPAFFAELNRLALMPDGEFAIHFDLFVSNLESDLRTEEQWMEDIDFASTKEHRALHAEALSVLHQAQARAMAGNVELARRAVELLPEWFVDHVLTMDLPLASALRLSTTRDKQADSELSVA